MGADIIEAVADKGYQSPEDMSRAFENGIIPDVYNSILSNPEIISVRSTEYTFSDDAVLSRQIPPGRDGIGQRICAIRIPALSLTPLRGGLRGGAYNASVPRHNSSRHR